MGRVLKLNSNIPNSEINETRENNVPTWQTRIHRVAVEIASTFVGQAMMMQFDKLLWTLEKTATWISNGKTDGKRAKAPTILIRPTPWVLFLPTLVVLRFTRVILSLISICFGYDEIEASTMVSFLHETRRTIRHITHEAKRNQVHLVIQTKQRSSMEYAKQIGLSILSNLKNLISQAPDTMKLHNNKTSLNAAVVGETNEYHIEDVTSNSDDSDSEDQIYQDFRKCTFEGKLVAPDTDDDDFTFDLNGEFESDTCSQSSIATEDLSDEDIETHRSIEVRLNAEKSTYGNATDNDRNHSSNSSANVADQIENANTNIHIDDAQSLVTKDDDDNYDALKIDDTTKVTSNTKSIQPHHNSGAKSIARYYKNGRFHAKPQNNGKQLNGAHTQGKSKPAKNHHVQSTNDFVANVADVAAAERS